ncbi:MAG TPA: hypothetical protein VHA14_04040 [Bryobacteraceae bacterium]|nr:hypothetical protein [Bryobacteraceae bacterium]
MSFFAMQPTFLRESLLLDALLGTGVIAAIVLSLALFVSAKREIRREARKREQSVAALAATIAALTLKIEQAAREPNPEAPAAKRNEAATEPALPLRKSRPGINLNWRIQALRLLRRGQDIGHVSTALGVSRREIELLIRVHQLASGRPTAGWREKRTRGAGLA